MARTARSKSGDEKQPAKLAPGIGECVQRAIEVAKQSKTLQEQIVTIAHAIEDYTRYKTKTDCDHNKGLERWIALCDAKDEIVKTILDTFGAITGLYDVIKSPPAEFEKVAASLVVVVSVIKGLSKMLDLGIERTLGGCCRVLDTANHRLDAAISELQWHFFRFVPSALSDDENSNDEISPTDWYKRTFDNIVAIAAQYGLVVETFGTDWKHIASELQKKAPDAPEWEDFTEEDDDSVEQACGRYLERKWREQFYAKTDENYRQIAKAFRLKLHAMQRRIKAESQEPTQPEKSGKTQHSNSAFFIISELAMHHQIDKQEPYTKPHSVRAIHKALGENIKSTSTVSDFFKKHFKDSDGTSGHAVYKKWCTKSGVQKVV